MYLHPFPHPVNRSNWPTAFTYPFAYTPHPLCLEAAQEVQHFLKKQTYLHEQTLHNKKSLEENPSALQGLSFQGEQGEHNAESSRKGKSPQGHRSVLQGFNTQEEQGGHSEESEQWMADYRQGKMMGVLVVETPQGETGFLCAYSGLLGGSNNHPYFVPPLLDLLQPDGFFKQEEAEISAINLRIAQRLQEEELLKAKQHLEEMKLASEEALTRAKAELKRAKEERHTLRASATLSAEEEQNLLKQSQFQKAEYKRLERRWKMELEETQLKYEALLKEIEQLKQERKSRSAALQQRLFSSYKVRNALGEEKDLWTLFADTTGQAPPSGAGDCAAPKLLQYAYLHNYRPLAMAEFWWGEPSTTELHLPGNFYPACQGKCGPILGFMLKGLRVEPNPLLKRLHRIKSTAIEVIYEDEWIVAVNKPQGLLSVPGKEQADSVWQWAKQHYPLADGPLVVHRLDMDTSGLLLIAKSKEVHERLQRMFLNHSIRKRYVALLEGIYRGNEEKEPKYKLDEELKSEQDTELIIKRDEELRSEEDKKLKDKQKEGLNKEQGIKSGTIDLPLCLNPDDRPRQMVHPHYGKRAITRYEIIGYEGERTRIHFYPLTGRTHQLRVHAAHPYGLHTPIVGDRLYGTPADRLYLHAEQLEFIHPMTGKRISLNCPAPF